MTETTLLASVTFTMTHVILTLFIRLLDNSVAVLAVSCAAAPASVLLELGVGCFLIVVLFLFSYFSSPK